MWDLTILNILGYVSLGLIIFSLIKPLICGFYIYVIGPLVNRVNFVSRGKWALVTGSTDGIGKEYARQLAALGCDIVLISRSMDKLKATAREIEKEFKVATKVIQVDFSGDDEIYDHIEKNIAGLDIGTLVNNVGVSYSYPEYFLELQDWENVTSTIVKANIVSMIRMTRLVLPAMVKKGKGVVINVGSCSSVIPSPLLTVYSATKAFVEKFSDDLRREYGNRNIIIQCIIPGYVSTNMTNRRERSIFTPIPKDYVKSALGLVGTTTKTTGYLAHTIFVNSIKLIYSILPSFCVWLVIQSMKDTRNKALKQ